MKVDGRVNRNGTDSKNITESGMSFSQNLGFQLLHNLDFLCSESKIASLTRLTFAKPEWERAQYEGENSITYSCLILMQPLGADQATVAHMEAVNVSFQ